MKIKPQYFALVAILFFGGVLGILFFSNGNMGDLFSRSVNPAAEENILEDVDPRPVVESLDALGSDESSIDVDKLLLDLQQELRLTEDPDKAMELRRRIQILKAKKQESTPTVNQEGI